MMTERLPSQEDAKKLMQLIAIDNYDLKKATIAFRITDRLHAFDIIYATLESMAKKQAGYFPNMYPKKGGREFQLRTGITAPSEIFHEGQTVYFEKTRWCAGPPSANVPTSTIRTYGIVTNDCIHFPFSGTRYYSSTYGSPTDKLADAPLPQVKIIIHRLNVLYNRCPVVKGIAQEPGITITDETVIDLHNSDRWVTTVDRADIRPGKSTNDDVLTNILEICSGKYPPPPLYG